MRYVHSLMLVGFLAGCGAGETSSGSSARPVEEQAPTGSGAPATAAPSPESLNFNPALNVDLAAMQKTPTGLYFRDLYAGDGEQAAPGQLLSVHYVGWLHDGTKFDSSRDRDEPFEFRLAAGQVIDGWVEGVQGMKLAGKRQLVIPPGLAYGAAGQPGVIPPNATLVFEVELLSIHKPE